MSTLGCPLVLSIRITKTVVVVIESNAPAAYAAYFDYKRRNDVNFRKALKRESKRQARVAREEAEIQGKQQREEIQIAVQEAIEEGFPTDIEEREAFFMQQIAQGETLAGDGMCQTAADMLPIH